MLSWGGVRGGAGRWLEGVRVPVDRLPGHSLVPHVVVTQARVCPCVPWVEVDCPGVHPGPIGKAEVLHGDADDPVGARDQLGDQGQQVLARVHSEHGEGSTNNV